MAKSNQYVVILCGGSGPRLWPLSHAGHPKQFLKILGKKTLLEQTFSRCQKFCPGKNIFIVSNQKYQAKIDKILGKKLPPQNFIYEPEKKNTTMAILLALAHIQKLNPDAVVTTTPADHYIKKIISFRKDIANSQKLAQNHHRIITIGIKPAFANTSYGYILPRQKNQPLSNVSLFVEKPDKDTAQNLIKKGALWNSGIYTFTLTDIVNEVEKLQPEYFRLYQQLVNSQLDKKTIAKVYAKSPDLAIDRAVSEKSDQIYVIPASFDWSDIGEWKSIHQRSDKDSDNNAVLNSQTNYLAHNSTNCLINGSKNKLIGLVGVSNLAVIDTDDGLLICHLDDSYHVRDLIGKMVKNKKYKSFFLKKP